jgi:mono/diheme cytochrome c family protein
VQGSATIIQDVPWVATPWGSGYHDMPSALRRVSGVNCLACHGPGTVPEPQGRWALLRADVCATCHDAPPRYGHVAAFKTSKMSRADADPRTRDDTCARCHTTWGFLDQPERRPPAHAGEAGIGCAACHAVHPEHREEGATTVGRVCAAALPREVAVPAALEGRVPNTAAKSRVCLPCHTPDGDGGPASSAAALWLGHGGLDPETGAPLDGEGPHAAVEGGCVGCHRSGPDGLGKGASHGFHADQAACAGCHAPKTEDVAAFRAQAQALFERLSDSTIARAGAGDTTGSAGTGRDPPHATPRRFDRSTPRGRALHDVLLVLEDRGAVAHNAPYARRLLDAAERALSRNGK